MTEETVTETKNTNGSKNTEIDDTTRKNAVKKVKKLNKRGAITIVAREIGVHPITISEWINNPKYNPDLKTPKSKMPNPTKKASTSKTNTTPKTTVKVSEPFSLREKIANLPTTYEELLWEHIQLLKKSNS